MTFHRRNFFRGRLLPDLASSAPFRVILVAAVLAVSTGCTGREESTTRGIEEIHREEGLPVQVRSVEPTPFHTYMSFTSSLSGASESVASALVGDKVREILYAVGDYVEQDTVVMHFPTDNPAINYEQARLGYEAARTAFDRVQRLFESEGISRQAYDDARTQFEVAQANWQAVRKMTQVRAPISGHITRINVSVSDNVARGDPLFTVSDFNRLKTTVWLTDRQVQEVTTGLPARAVWQDREVTGEVVQVDLAMDQTRKAFAAKLRFENPGRVIRSGVTARVEIETYRNREAIILNQREVLAGGEGHSVLIVQDDVARRVPVTIARRQGLLVEIGSGLQREDLVITGGYDLASDGQPVRIMEHGDKLVQR
ncbi:MAG: efflux RND transporter periplasmic adaptor subunit [Spirochaetaceae bacterium]|nr:MAG: efflux RND transporter periplasmic adaptor subunit [Spirochaetaceae bacterium]